MTIDSAALSPEEIRRRVADYEWYHTINLGHGIITPGQYDLAQVVEHYGLPARLDGQSVLDVGPAHGFFAFEFERRGAKVATTELPNWIDHDASPALREADSKGPPADEYHRGAFGFAIQARGSRIERHFCNIYDLTPQRVGVFDLVFCASVLLHLTDPLRALYGLRRVCGREAIICTGGGRRALCRDGRRPCVLVPDPDLSRTDGVGRRVLARRARLDLPVAER